MYRRVKAIAYIQQRRVSGLRKYNWPPPLPIEAPSGTRGVEFYARWGRSVNSTALCSALARRRDPGTSADLLRRYESDTTAEVLALALSLHEIPASPLSDTYYRYIGQVAEQKGLDTAVSWVKELYGPFLDAASVQFPRDAGPEASAAEASAAEASAAEARSTEASATGLDSPPAYSATESAPHQDKHPEKYTGPIDLYGDDDMSLFDPESWLKESPTAQRLWKEHE